MSRPLGAKSVTSMTLPQLLKKLGPDYKGHVFVGSTFLKQLEAMRTGGNLNRMEASPVVKEKKSATKPKATAKTAKVAKKTVSAKVRSSKKNTVPQVFSQAA